MSHGSGPGEPEHQEPEYGAPEHGDSGHKAGEPVRSTDSLETPSSLEIPDSLTPTSLTSDSSETTDGATNDWAPEASWPRDEDEPTLVEPLESTLTIELDAPTEELPLERGRPDFQVPHSGLGLDAESHVAARPARTGSYRTAVAAKKGGRTRPSRYSRSHQDEDLGEPTLVDIDPDQVLAATPARRRRHRGRWAVMISLLLVVVLAIGLLVAEALVRRTVDERLQQNLVAAFHTDQVTSRFEDRSMLWSAARGRLDRLTVAADDARVISKDDSELAIQRLDLRASSITHFLNPQDAIIGDLQANALINFDELTRLAGAEIGPDPDTPGRVQLQRRISVFGVSLVVQVSAVLALDSQTGRVRLEDAKGQLNRLPVPGSLLRSALASVLANTTLPPIDGLTYDRLVTTSQGVRVEMSGKDVPLANFMR